LTLLSRVSGLLFLVHLQPFVHFIMIRFCARTDIGLKRVKNDDCFLTVADPAPGLDIKRMGFMFAVADGMGGHPAGDVASRIACETVKNYYYDVFSASARLYAGTAAFPCTPLVNRIVLAFHQADKEIASYGYAHRDCAGLGTTLSILVLKRRWAIIGHVGDSRIYRMRAGQLDLLTRDHTFVQDLIDSGGMSLEEARKDPMRHMLTQAVGQGLERVFTRCERISAGDSFLLCSDGLHDMVANKEIAAVMEKDVSVEEICERLIQKALDNGGRDNVTVIVVRCTENKRIMPENK